MWREVYHNAQVKKIFDLFDTNKNGILNNTEYGLWLQRTGHEMAGAPGDTLEKRWAAEVEGLGCDNSGIPFETFLTKIYGPGAVLDGWLNHDIKQLGLN